MAKFDFKSHVNDITFGNYININKVLHSQLKSIYLDQTHRSNAFTTQTQ